VTLKKPKIYRDAQIDISILKARRIAILGYGSQGRAQALNMRDTGIIPVIGLPARSKSRPKAKRDGFAVLTPPEAIANADLIAVLIPDHLQGQLFSRQLKESIRPGQTFIFAHGLAVHFGFVRQPRGVDFIMVAPHAPGIRLRERYLENKGVPAFIARTDESSKGALKLALAYGKAIGCARAGLIRTTFADEAIGDIFGEQAVLCGGLAGLLKAGFGTLVEDGLSPYNAYLECVYQLDLIIDLIKRYGIDGMYERISLTAAYGGRLAENRMIGPDSRKAMRSLLADIKKGKFTRSMLDAGGRRLEDLKSRKSVKADKILDIMAHYFDRHFGD